MRRRWLAGGQVVVDGGAGDAEEVGDLLDGLLPRVVELLGEGGLVGCEAGASAADAAAGAGGGEAVAGVGDDQFALELGEDGEHAEHGAAFDGGGVDALLDDVQADAALAQLGAEGDEVQDGAGEPVQAGDDEGVAGAQKLQDEVEVRAGGFRPGGGVGVDVALGDAGAQQGVDLVGGVLVRGGDPRPVADDTGVLTASRLFVRADG